MNPHSPDPDGPSDAPPGLVAYALTDEHTLFVFDLPMAPAEWRLTTAEREVAELIVRGRTNAAIAAQRGVSPPTVAKQVASVFAKAGVRSRAELVAAIVRRPDRHRARVSADRSKRER